MIYKIACLALSVNAFGVASSPAGRATGEPVLAVLTAQAHAAGRQRALLLRQTAADNEDRARPFREIFHMPESVRPLSLIVLGHTDQEFKAVERFRAERVHKEDW